MGNELLSPSAKPVEASGQDAVSTVLKWVLLGVAVVTFALLAWATTATYRLAPPQPDRFVGADGTVLMTGEDVVAGKGAFQKADLMDTAPRCCGSGCTCREMSCSRPARC